MPKLISQKRFCDEALEAHNKYRRIHDAQQLELSSELTAQALEWVEKLAEIGSLKYRNARWLNEPIGENILRTKVFYFGGDECTDEWYKEQAFYKYDDNFNPLTGHFTQIVWKETCKVGFAYAQTMDGYFYVVANYFPAGNFKHEFRKNVSRPLVSKVREPAPRPSLRIEPRNADDYYKTNEPIMESRGLPVNEPRRLLNVQNNDKIDSNNPLDVFIKEAIDAHNFYRRNHGSEPLIHNPEISTIAQNYANYLAKIGNMVHSSNKYRNEKLGENLFFSFDSRAVSLSGMKPTQEWYNEINQYYFKDYQPGTGHFTQVVWKSSREIGLGFAKAKDGSFFVVANYYPAGNMIGKFNENVKRPIN